jgi:3-oxoacyl-[acyl-carrier protein] reductase
MAERERPVAIVTGAGRGLGRATAVALAARGFDVVVNERSPGDDTSATALAVAAAGGRAVAAHADLGDLGAHAGFLDAAWEAFGGVDCLVNNAGVSVLSRGDLLDATPESFDRCMAVNTRGTFFLTQAFARRLLAEPAAPFRRGIAFVTSMNAEVLAPNRGEYCVSKAAAAMAAQLFAVRLAPHGIAVYDIRPGIIRTEMTEASRDRYDRFFAEGGAPVARWGEPDEVGRTVAALLAGELPYTVGQVVRVDGGASMRII